MASASVRCPVTLEIRSPLCSSGRLTSSAAAPFLAAAAESLVEISKMLQSSGGAADFSSSTNPRVAASVARSLGFCVPKLLVRFPIILDFNELGMVRMSYGFQTAFCYHAIKRGT